MREVRFAKALYVGEQVDAAVKVYAPYGTLTTSEDTDHWVVAIEAGSAARERRLEGELGNYALGLTIRHQAAESAKDSSAEESSAEESSVASSEENGSETGGASAAPADDQSNGSDQSNQTVEESPDESSTDESDEDGGAS